jgi:hypothetical protein
MSPTPNGQHPDCRHARLHIGGDPGALPPEVSAHVATCAECRGFRDETAMLDGRLRAALELPLSRFTTPASAPVSAPRRFAMAASVVLALVLAGGAWLLRSQDALANEIVAHVKHEPGSWDAREPVAANAVTDVLRLAGVEFDSSLPVVYAQSCPFRGKRVPHLVVQTRDGPMTVMLLGGEPVAKRREFSEEGYRGVLLPAGGGSVVVLARGAGAAPDAVASDVVNAVHWR